VLINVLAGIIVIAFGLFLIGLAGVVFARPGLAERFFMAFASSARAHYTEQTLRLLIGVSLVVLSSAMWQADLFRLIGWLIVVTSIGLLLVPWRWHQRFAEWVLPMVIRHMRLYAVGLFVFGAFLLYSVFCSGPSTVACPASLFRTRIDGSEWKCCRTKLFKQCESGKTISLVRVR
jgi:hypothetical protein